MKKLGQIFAFSLLIFQNPSELIAENEQKVFDSLISKYENGSITSYNLYVILTNNIKNKIDRNPNVKENIDLEETIKETEKKVEEHCAHNNSNLSEEKCLRTIMEAFDQIKPNLEGAGMKEAVQAFENAKSALNNSLPSNYIKGDAE